MEKYNYLESIKEDIKNLIRWGEIETPNKDNYQEIYDYLYIDDSVTGNASGSYYCNSYKAQKALLNNLDLLQDACEEYDKTPRLDNPEECDLIIRCHLLSQALNEVIEEIEEEKEEE